MKEMYGDQFGEFVCGYWGLRAAPEIYQNSVSENCHKLSETCKSLTA